MQIAVIGAANVGTALSSAAAPGGPSVTLTAAHPECARAAATVPGATASNTETVPGADLTPNASTGWVWRSAWAPVGPKAGQ